MKFDLKDTWSGEVYHELEAHETLEDIDFATFKEYQDTLETLNILPIGFKLVTIEGLVITRMS